MVYPYCIQNRSILKDSESKSVVEQVKCGSYRSKCTHVSIIIWCFISCAKIVLVKIDCERSCKCDVVHKLNSYSNLDIFSEYGIKQGLCPIWQPVGTTAVGGVGVETPRYVDHFLPRRTHVRTLSQDNYPGLTSIHRKCFLYNSIHQVCGKMLVIQFSYNFLKWLKTGINLFLLLFDSNKTVWW